VAAENMKAVAGYENCGIIGGGEAMAAAAKKMAAMTKAKYQCQRNINQIMTKICRKASAENEMA
jgi:hypothetical protein